MQRKRVSIVSVLRGALPHALWVAAMAVTLFFVHANAAAATLTVGPGKTYAKPCQAIAAASAGDVIEVDASGSYAGDTCAWSTENLTIRGVGGRAKIDLAGVTPAQQKGIFTIQANDATVESFELSGAAISATAGNNAAGIRHQGQNLTVRNCFFHDNQNGILGAPSAAGAGNVLIERSEFAHNGAGDGFSHNMYLGNYARVTLQYSYSHQANVGHLFKSRAHTSLVLYNRITDENGTASYEIDLPNGGLGIVVGNVIEQSATTENPAIVSFAEEGVPAGYDDHLYVVNDTFLNDKGSGTFVVDAAISPALLENDIFWNGGTVTSQASAVLTTNFDSSTKGDPKFVALAQFDAHLAAGSPCIDMGTAPGSGGGESLAPVFEYVHPLSERTRAVVGSAVDIGAFEYGNVGSADAGAGDAASSDANAGGADGAVDAEASDAAASGGAGAGGGASSSSGCGCDLARRPRDAGWITLLVAGGALAVRRRRRTPSAVD